MADKLLGDGVTLGVFVELLEMDFVIVLDVGEGVWGEGEDDSVIVCDCVDEEEPVKVIGEVTELLTDGVYDFVVE